MLLTLFFFLLLTFHPSFSFGRLEWCAWSVLHGAWQDGTRKWLTISFLYSVHILELIKWFQVVSNLHSCNHARRVLFTVPWVNLRLRRPPLACTHHNQQSRHCLPLTRRSQEMPPLLIPPNTDLPLATPPLSRPLLYARRILFDKPFSTSSLFLIERTKETFRSNIQLE